MASPPRRPSIPNNIISASRRTELLAHHPDYLIHRLRHIGPHNVHTLVIWTKDPTNLLRHQPLREILSDVGQLFVHWTVTGLGGTFLEPNVPPAPDQLPLLDDLVSYLGDPRRLHWRYDPLISARRGDERATNISARRGEERATNIDLDLDLFRSLAEPFARAGVPVVHTSFVTIYPKVTRRLASASVEIDDYDPDARRDFIARLAASASGLGLRLQTCCEPGFPIQRCIDGPLLQQLHPTNSPCPTTRAPNQRKLCGCTLSLDIGRYLPCPNRCLYCYAHPAP
jgi:hypothetical protein